MSHYVVMTANTKGRRYKRIAVVETSLSNHQIPLRIDSRACGLVRIVKTWEKLHVGKSSSSAYHRALLEANRLADKLNEVDDEE